jgi:hypothetical protein
MDLALGHRAGLEPRSSAQVYYTCPDVSQKERVERRDRI